MYIFDAWNEWKKNWTKKEGESENTMISNERQVVVAMCSFHWESFLTSILKPHDKKKQTHKSKKKSKNISHAYTLNEQNKYISRNWNSCHNVSATRKKESSLKTWLNSYSDLFSSHPVLRDERRIINLKPWLNDYRLRDSCSRKLLMRNQKASIFRCSLWWMNKKFAEHSNE